MPAAYLFSHGHIYPRGLAPDLPGPALGSADGESVAYYSELLEIGLGDSPARSAWRDMMGVGTYFPGRGTIVEESYLEGKAAGQAEGKSAGKAEGQAEERARFILRLLEQRGVQLPAGSRERVTACTDLDTLGIWLDRAFTVTDAAELFAEAGAEEGVRRDGDGG